MIVGIGTDICDISRIERIVKRQKGFAERILTVEEITTYKKRSNSAQYLASRFAAKEATLKALGTGLAQGINWHDLETSHLQSGQPVMSLYGRALQIANEKQVAHIHLSLSDEKAHALAFVVMESSST